MVSMLQPGSCEGRCWSLLLAATLISAIMLLAEHDRVGLILELVGGCLNGLRGSPVGSEETKAGKEIRTPP